jgi:hypothetical protein
MIKTSYYIVILTMLLLACNNNSNQTSIDISTQVTNEYNIKFKQALDSIEVAKKYIQNGDLICRTGFDFVSQSLQNFNTVDKTYSHSGLAFIENGTIMVYHAIGGIDENPHENFKKEPFDSFVNPKRKVGFGIFRYQLNSNEIACVNEQFKNLEKRQVKFDKYFNLKDDDKQYCSEAIAKTLKKCTNNRITIPTTVKENMKIKNKGYEHLKGKRFEYIALDNLYLNPFCTLIKQIKYTIGYAKP